jgi:hypothetical protein
MSLWFAKVDLWVSDGTKDAVPERVQMSMLLESDDFLRVSKEAERIAETNAPFGKRLHAVEFRESHNVQLPARVHVHQRSP